MFSKKHRFLSSTDEKSCFSPGHNLFKRWFYPVPSLVLGYLRNYGLSKNIYKTLFLISNDAGSRWTVDGEPFLGSLRKVLPRSGLGNHASGRGENLCRGAETTQLKDKAMIHMVMRSPWELMKRPLCPQSKPKYWDQLSRLLKGRAHSRIPSKTEGGLRPTPSTQKVSSVIYITC